MKSESFIELIVAFPPPTEVDEQKKAFTSLDRLVYWLRYSPDRIMTEGTKDSLGHMYSRLQHGLEYHGMSEYSNYSLKGIEDGALQAVEQDIKIINSLNIPIETDEDENKMAKFNKLVEPYRHFHKFGIEASLGLRHLHSRTQRFYRIIGFRANGDAIFGDRNN